MTSHHFHSSPPPCPAAPCSASTAPQPLARLHRGQSAIIHSIKAQGVLGRRLRDMGLMPGVTLEVTGLAPLGDPMSVHLNGYALSLRTAEAVQVWVCPTAPTEEALAEEKQA